VELSHEFEVPVGADDAFAVLTDVERIAPCMPGATLDEVDGDRFTGRVKVKVGPVQMTYRGEAEMTERDPEQYRAVIVAKGQETRGGGTAQATITATLTAVATDRTAVTVHTDLVLTGKPAQFGRGVIGDVGDKLLGRFADCLADELSGEAAPEPAPEPAAPVGTETPSSEPLAADTARPTAETPAPVRPRREPDTIDLLDVAGGSVAKRLVPVAAVIALVALVLWWRRR
jgi:carbon monoxide dehydrogenase subunit G